MAGTPKEQLVQRLTSYPKDAVPFLQNAFAEAARLPAASRELVLQKLLESFSLGRREVDGAELRHVENLNERDAELVASVYSLIIGFLTELDVTPNEFVDAAKDVLFSPKDEPTALSIAESICSRRAEIASAIERAQLSGKMLPNLRKFDLSPDIRLKIDGGAVKAAIAIAVLHLDTDRDGQEVWVQLNQLDLEEMVKKLNDCLASLKIAEGVIPKDPR